MKPTISNAFNDDSASSTPPANSPAPSPASPDSGRELNAWDVRKPAHKPAPHTRGRNPRKSLAASLAPMQVDLREASFGFSMELSPMHAADAVAALHLAVAGPLAFLVNIEQSTWREGDEDMSVSAVAERLSIPIVELIDANQLVLEAASLHQLVSLCQPTRLLAVAVEGPIETGDVRAMNQAVTAGHSPLGAELRALAAIEVMGDRSVVLHCRERAVALALVAENFRHYLGAFTGRPATQFASPELWQLERLIGVTGSLTVRPIETQAFSTSIDVGVNTARERFSQPANRSLIYDIPSNTWHDEP
jgi:hypothetical protein